MLELENITAGYGDTVVLVAVAPELISNSPPLLTIVKFAEPPALTRS